jgi:hypothetical protein
MFYKIKKITIVALVSLIVTASIIIGCKVDTQQASVTEVSEALKRCYILQHALDNQDALGDFTVKDVQFGNKTTLDLSGRHITIWEVKAKLYDAKGQYVEDLDQNLVKMDLGGWVCQ